MAVPSNISDLRSFAAGWTRVRWTYVAIGAVVLINFAMLLVYQHYLAGDFPFQDEIGYLNRLHQLPETGFFHYLFDPYWYYYMPTQLFIWYEFYVRTHLNIMTVRYTGAAISALTALLLCVMLYRNATRVNPLTFLVILCGAFMVCSYNNWASYDQSIEAVVEPLMFGLVLALTWMADRIHQTFEDRAPIRSRLAWIGLFVIIWMLAVGIGAPPLVLLLAIVGARVLLERRIDLPLIVLGIIGIAVPALYVLSGEGLNTGFSASHSAFGFKELFDAFEALIGLVGNSLYSPLANSREFITFLLGAGVLAAQAVATVYALRHPPEQRSRFMIPLTLTIYGWLVLLEIIGARLHETGLAFTPRYTWFGLYAPVSILFWSVMLADSFRWKRVFGIFTVVLISFGVMLADAQTVHQLPYVRVALAGVRATFMSLRGHPTRQQQVAMFVNNPLVDYVYPDLQFLQQEHLAMYEGSEATAPLKPLPSKPLALTVVGFGPEPVRAGIPFLVQKNGLSAVWVRTNTQTDGDVFIVINGTKLQSFHRDDIVTAFVPAALYKRRGVYPMYVVEASGEKTTRSNSVNFVVR